LADNREPGSRPGRTPGGRKPQSRDSSSAGPAKGKPPAGGKPPFRSGGDARSGTPQGSEDRPWRKKPEGDPREHGQSARPWQKRADGDRRPPRADGDRRPPRADGDRRPPRADGDRRPFRPSDDRRGARPDGDRRPPRADGDRRPSGAESDRRPFRSDGERRPPRTEGGRGPRTDGRPARSFDQSGAHDRGARPQRGGRDRDTFDKTRATAEDKDPFGIKSVRPRHDDPEIPADVEPRDLDRVARAELKTLSKENADEVAKHLVMAARLIDEFPELAHRHAMSAGRRAGRVAVVRETLAITAYAIGDFALALRELRTYRRISGSNDQLPLMVDSERGLGRPDRALELGRSVPKSELPVPVQVELAIAMSGARLDLGQTEAALAELEIPQLDPKTAYFYSPALFDSYAAVLEELGRTDDAAFWAQLADRAAEALGETSGGDDETVEVIEEEFDLGDDQEDVHEDAGEAAEEPKTEAEADADDAGPASRPSDQEDDADEA
jgi:hypothetical protein